MKITGYVGCQTNRPFGIAGESFENPLYLGKMIETVGAQALGSYDQKVTCCGGAPAFSEPDKSQKQIRDIVESAYDHGAEMIVTLWQRRQGSRPGRACHPAEETAEYCRQGCNKIILIGHKSA
jgi:hypothetical protein